MSKSASSSPARTGILLLSITAAALLSACASSSAENVTPEQVAALISQQSQETQQNLGLSSTQAAQSSPAAGWTLHMDAPKRFPGSPEMLAHHYCKSVGGGMTQCQIYDADSSEARLVGVEVIVPPNIYANFSAEEKARWHYLRSEFSTGTVTFPDVAASQNSAMAGNLEDSYGKVYLLWDPTRNPMPAGLPGVGDLTGTESAQAPAKPADKKETAVTPAPAQPAPASGDFQKATFDIYKVISSGFQVKKGNFDYSILTQNANMGVELFQIKKVSQMHKHERETHIMYVVSGSGELTMDGKKTALKPGVIAIVPHGVPHSMVNLGKDPLTLVMISTPPMDANDVELVK